MTELTETLNKYGFGGNIAEQISAVCSLNRSDIINYKEWEKDVKVIESVIYKGQKALEKLEKIKKLKDSKTLYTLRSGTAVDLISPSEIEKILNEDSEKN